MSVKNIGRKMKNLLSGITLGAAALVAGSSVGCEEQIASGQATFSEASIKSVAGGGDFNPLTAKKAQKKATRK